MNWVKLITRIRVTDNSTLLAASVDGIPKVIDLIADQELISLERQGILLFPGSMAQSQDMTSKQVVLKSKGKTQYQTGNLMGLVQVDDEQLVIASRFSPLETDYFLHYMLAKVLDIPNLLNLVAAGGDGTNTYDFASFLFPQSLKASLRKGVYKSYQTVEYNDSSVRGGLDLARHIRINTPFTGRVAYKQREFTLDNPLTQLVRHTIELLKTKPHLSMVLDTAHEEISKVIEVTPSYRRADRMRVIQHAERLPIRHAYFHEYSLLQRICLFILKQVRHGLEDSPMKIHGVLFDGAWLWEEYVNTLIGEYFYHPLNKAGVGREHLFTSERGGLTGSIFPDFIGKDRSAPVVADAKYKPQRNINGSDFHQILSYMFRFEADKGFFFYPCNLLDTREKNSLYRLNGGSTMAGNLHRSRDIFVEKVGLSIPQKVSSSTEFAQKMEEQEQVFLSSVLETELTV